MPSDVARRRRPAARRSCPSGTPGANVWTCALVAGAVGGVVDDERAGAHDVDGERRRRACATCAVAGAASVGQRGGAGDVGAQRRPGRSGRRRRRPSPAAPSTVTSRRGPSTTWAAVTTRPSPTTTPTPSAGSRAIARLGGDGDDRATSARPSARRRAQAAEAAPARSGRRRGGVGAEQAGDAFGDPAGRRAGAGTRRDRGRCCPGTRAPVTTNWAAGKRRRACP